MTFSDVSYNVKTLTFHIIMKRIFTVMKKSTAFGT